MYNLERTNTTPVSLQIVVASSISTDVKFFIWASDQREKRVEALWKFAPLLSVPYQATYTYKKPHT